MTIAFLQPFGVRSPGGGPRILRAMLAERPMHAISICTAAAAPPEAPSVTEVHCSPRPTLGRLESTRVHRYLGLIALGSERVLQRRVLRLLHDHEVECVHLVAHDASFWPAFRAARQLDLPVVLSVHDHLSYAMRGRPELALSTRRLGHVWRLAAERLVISRALGDEYARRFGPRPYGVVTDGIDEVRSLGPVSHERCTVYFMGAFHVSYRENLVSLLHALERHQAEHPALAVKLRLRCGELPGGMPPTSVSVEPLPLADEQVVLRDLEEVDLLWFPLPHGEEHREFVRYSLSTKLVTYLGSGVPILYQGPRDAAAAVLLKDRHAAVEAGSLEPEEVARTIAAGLRDRETLVGNAARLAQESFMLRDVRARFWRAVQNALAGAGASGTSAGTGAASAERLAPASAPGAPGSPPPR